MKYTIILVAFWLVIATASVQDLQKAEAAIAREEYRMAEAYLLGILQVEEDKSIVSEAMYHLCTIYSKTHEFLPLLTHANTFLTRYSHSKQGQQVFDMLLKMLCERHAYTIAIEYIHNYDFLIEDDSLLLEISLGLWAQGKDIMTDYMLSLCTEQDTVLSLRAALASDQETILSYYSRLSNPRRALYSTLFHLAEGDTIKAHDRYISIEPDKITEELIYPYAKLARIFNEQQFKQSIQNLRRVPGYEMKAALLNALDAGKVPKNIVIRDSEECSLLVRCLQRKVLEWKWDGPFLEYDSVTLEQIDILRDSLGNSYYLDSLQAHLLLREDSIAQAWHLMGKYIDYLNTERFARSVRAQFHYANGNYPLAAKDLILSQRSEPFLLYKLARSFTFMDRDALPLYEEVLEKSSDSLLIDETKRRIMAIQFEREEYEAVRAYSWELFKNDIDLIKMYLYSLAATGEYDQAQSLFMETFGQSEPLIAQFYGDYLIERRKFRSARAFYDSLHHAGQIAGMDRAYYHWALVPFLQEESDTALARFRMYINRFPEGEFFHKAYFKIATAYYLQQRFDSAAYFYGVASSDKELRQDALQNQLVCKKKAGYWRDVVGIAEALLPSATAEEEPDLWFDIGYGYLRSGKAGVAVDYLTRAVRLQSNPEYHYWLAEAYLTKGDFLRSLWQYQKVVDLFPEDEMWMPTAQYKTGIVFEFLDEFDQARKVYEAIIRTRGTGDTWSREAQQRLEELR